MPRLLLFVPSESVSIDQQTNRLSVFHVLEQINLPSFPATLRELYIVTLWQRNRSEDPSQNFFQTIDLRDPDGTALSEPRRVQFQLSKKRHRLVSIVNNLQIHRAGQHEMRLYIHPQGETEMRDEFLAAAFPLEVQQVQRRTMPGEVPPALEQ
jgi:hypothetical protein